MDGRLQLVTQCLGNKIETMLVAVKYLRDCMQQEEEVMEVITLDDSLVESEVVAKSKAQVAWEFLVLLYMKLPKITYFLNENEKKRICKLSHVSGKKLQSF